MQTQDEVRRRPSLSLPILRASRDQHRAGTLTLGSLLSELGETSFGWALMIFALLTMLPLPPGSSLITALPMLLTTAQMALGYPHVRLPGRLARVSLNLEKLRRSVLRLRPVTRWLERILKQRYQRLFGRRLERSLGVALFVIAFALFLPVPGSGWFPAISLFIIGVAMIERDGLVVALGLGFGALSVLLTATIVLSVTVGLGSVF